MLAKVSRYTVIPNRSAIVDFSIYMYMCTCVHVHVQCNMYLGSQHDDFLHWLLQLEHSAPDILITERVTVANIIKIRHGEGG